VQDLVGVAVDSPTTSLPQVRAGLIKAYAVTAKSRLPAAPDIPTAGEAGLPGMYLSVWFALWAPKGTPQDVIAKLGSAARHALADPSMASRLSDLGQEIVPSDQQTPEALSAIQRRISKNGGQLSRPPASRRIENTLLCCPQCIGVPPS
jgi:tripartite-type tricarboxylate transporter receptor subunit TctC